MYFPKLWAELDFYFFLELSIPGIQNCQKKKKKNQQPYEGVLFLSKSIECISRREYFFWKRSTPDLSNLGLTPPPPWKVYILYVLDS